MYFVFMAWPSFYFCRDVGCVLEADGTLRWIRDKSRFTFFHTAWNTPQRMLQVVRTLAFTHQGYPLDIVQDKILQNGAVVYLHRAVKALGHCQWLMRRRLVKRQIPVMLPRDLHQFIMDAVCGPHFCWTRFLAAWAAWCP